jgi:hypothetical protein
MHILYSPWSAQVQVWSCAHKTSKFKKKIQVVLLKFLTVQNVGLNH